MQGGELLDSIFVKSLLALANRMAPHFYLSRYLLHQTIPLTQERPGIELELSG